MKNTIGTISTLFAATILFHSCENTIHKAAEKFTEAHRLGLFTEDWKAPDTSTIPNNAEGDLILYGRDLIANTGNYFGPAGKINHNANGMNCQNCHLDAGTKLYANSFSAVYSNYPKFRARSGDVEHLEKRINDCMERSMNGKKIDSLSREMLAMKAYINWVGSNVKRGVTPEGASVVDLKYLDRAADPKKGELVYQRHCVTCHGADGLGKLNADSLSFLYPPLWGPRSYNTAAGLYRLTRFAGYVKSNMPNLTSSHAKPTLTDEEAWDVAAYVNSMPRPEKHFKEDWPDISKKPIDHPYGPFADKFSEYQHKYGPFYEIKEATKKK
jgi:thiosulfate dehydrogenase